MNTPSIAIKNHTLTPPFSQSTDGRADYLEPIAKGYQSLSNNPKTVSIKPSGFDDNTSTKCGYWSMLGQCEHGHGFARTLSCGREWCEECREDYEARRFSRWLPKAQQIGMMGYLVIAPPRNRRPRTKAELSKVRRSVVRGLKRLGFNRGLSRWHWFGDKSNSWYPHLNILLDCGYIPKDKMDDVKAMVARAFRVNMIVVNYRYSDKVSQKVHWLKYIVRATFLDKGWDEAMARELYGYMNTHSWGKWEDEPVWQLAEGQKEATMLAELETGHCPYCHTKIKWKGGREGLIRTDCLHAFGLVELGGGYYGLAADIAEHGGHFEANP